MLEMNDSYDKRNMSETLESYDKISHISANPWLYDDELSKEEQIYWKLKDVCHKCGYKTRYHREFCVYSASNMLMATFNTFADLSFSDLTK